VKKSITVNDATRAVKAVLSELKTTYPTVELSNDDKKYLTTTLPVSYVQGKIYKPAGIHGIINKLYKTNAQNVRAIFRKANLLHDPAKGTERNPDKMRNYLARLHVENVTRSRRPTNTTNPYESKIGKTKVGRVVAKLNAARRADAERLAKIIEDTGATKEQVNAAVKATHESGTDDLIGTLADILSGGINLGKRQANWRESTYGTLPMAEPAYSGLLKPATFTFTAPTGGPGFNVSRPPASLSPPPAPNDPAMEAAMNALAKLGI
jgi:hypothetical protein